MAVFWVTGGLSSFLDNAPTYLTFASMAGGLMGTEAVHLDQLLRAVTGGMYGEAPNGDLCWRGLHGSEYLYR